MPDSRGMFSPDEIRSLLQEGQQGNQIDQTTPFGETIWSNNAPEVMNYDDWYSSETQKHADDPNYTGGWFGGTEGTAATPGMYVNNPDDKGTIWQPGTPGTPGTIQTPQEAYQDYESNFERGFDPSVEINFSDEIQGIWDKVFADEGERPYQSYSDDYMTEYDRLTDPIYSRQNERLQQTMANRGQPLGGEVYDDSFENLYKSQNDATTAAARQAQIMADSARDRDYNRLMTAMGLSQVQTPQSDPNALLNTLLNQSQMANQLNQWDQQRGDNRRDSNLNALVGLGGAALMNPGLFSSKDYKENKQPVDTLDKLMSIPVEKWNYNIGIDKAEHIGPYAEDFQKAFGVGDGKHIAIIDAIGVLMRSVQELTEEVRRLK